MTTKEFNPFLFYSYQLQDLLQKASTQKNPALWLYENNARTTLFMLEALTRLHNNAFDEKFFEKWNKRFKKLEDLFGEIDQHIALKNELKLNKNISNEVVKYFTVNATNFLEKCNRRLIQKSWFNNKLKSFDYKLSEFDVEYNQGYLDELKYSMIDEIDAILKFVENSNYQFTKIEEEVHELRRKLRWLSIYAQALQGLIQLKKIPGNSKKQINYFTKEILNSPYNKLPIKPKNATIIQYNSDSFFALSWLIKELGRLKDTGLTIEQLSHAIYITEELSEMEALDKAISILGQKKTIQKDILTEASAILKSALSKDKILDNLIIL
jgi:hypothetical protein